MEKLTLATKEHDGTWFGVLISNQSGLLACSFSSSRKSLEKHLRSDAPSNPIQESTNESNIALTEMINIYEGELWNDSQTNQLGSKSRWDRCRKKPMAIIHSLPSSCSGKPRDWQLLHWRGTLGAWM